MKILLVTPEYPPLHVGGGGEVYKKLAENYLRLGNEVTVLFGDYTNQRIKGTIEEYSQDGINFIKVPLLKYPKKFLSLRTILPTNILNLKIIKNIIIDGKFDVAHIHGYGHMFIDQIAVILAKLNIPYIFSAHGFPETHKNNIFFRKLFEFYDKTRIQHTLKNSSLITGVSDYITYDAHFSNYSTKLATILNGIDSEEYKNYNFIDIKKEYNLPTNSVTILSIGRLAEMKGFQLMIEKLPKLLEKNINTYYFIAGVDGGYKKDLEILIDKYNLKERVIFLGWKDKKDIVNLINSLDYFCIPSLFDPCPIAAFEGMACNKWVITTFAGGIKEIYSTYPNTLNINNSTFIDEFENVVKNKIRAKIFDTKSYEWKEVAKRYLILMSELIKSENIKQ